MEIPAKQNLVPGSDYKHLSHLRYFDFSDLPNTKFFSKTPDAKSSTVLKTSLLGKLSQTKHSEKKQKGLLTKKHFEISSKPQTKDLKKENTYFSEQGKIKLHIKKLKNCSESDEKNDLSKKNAEKYKKYKKEICFHDFLNPNWKYLLSKKHSPGKKLSDFSLKFKRDSPYPIKNY